MASRNPYSRDENPYLAPEADDIESDEDIADEEMEDIRKKYLNHEASVQGIGSLYFIGGVLTTLGAFFFALVLVNQWSKIPDLMDDRAGRAIAFGIGFVLFYFVIGGLNLWIGWSLRKLKNWARITVGIINIPGLIAFPIGTIICGLFLYVLFSEKGKYVCSPEYHEVIAATPHIKYRTSIIVKILAIILLVIISLALVSWILGGAGR